MGGYKATSTWPAQYPTTVTRACPRISSGRNLEEQSGFLAENGADFILAEMTGSRVEQALLAVEAVSVHGLPVWLSISCALDDDSGVPMLGIQESRKHSPNATHHEPLSEAARKLAEAPISALLMMHSDLSAAGPAVRAMIGELRSAE